MCAGRRALLWRAAHDRISAQWGSTLVFVRRIDSTYGRP